MAQAYSPTAAGKPTEMLAKGLLNAGRASVSIKERAINPNMRKVSSNAKGWVIKHPYQTAFHVTSGVLFLAPALVALPVLGAVGFGTTIAPGTSLFNDYVVARRGF